MSACEDRWPRRHPLCICPEVSFMDILDGKAPDLDACRAQSGGITHPVMTIEEGRRLVADIVAGRVAF